MTSPRQLLGSSHSVALEGLRMQHSQQLRTVFGMTKAKPVNPQIHTHEKYKKVTPQPTYE